jgi:hypothetical protein
MLAAARSPGPLLELVDLREPLSPRPLVSLGVDAGAGLVAAASGGGYLAVAERRNELDPEWLTLYNIADPGRPRRMADVPLASPYPEPGDDDVVRDLALAGDLLLVGMQTGTSTPVEQATGSLVVWQVLPVGPPRRLARLALPSPVADIATAGRHAYLALSPLLQVTDQNGTRPASPAQLRVVDLTAPGAPRTVAELPFAHFSQAVAVEEDVVAVAFGDRSTIWLADVRTPEQPLPLGEVEVGPVFGAPIEHWGPCHQEDDGTYCGGPDQPLLRPAFDGSSLVVVDRTGGWWHWR